jgi:serine/threonine protein kinase
MQSQLVSDYIVKHYASVRVGHKLYLVLEYCGGGTLRKLLEERRPLYADDVPVRERRALTETETQRLMGQLTLGLSELQQAGIMHRDLKPENLLFQDSDRQQMKISDFGVARSLNDCADSHGASTHVGSNGYKPPEVLGGGLHDLRGDMWSIGIILYEILTGRRPFLGLSDHPLLQNIKRMCPNQHYMEEVGPLTANCVDLLGRLLQPDRDERIDFAAFERHPWIVQAVEMAINDEEPGAAVTRRARNMHEPD